MTHMMNVGSIPLSKHAKWIVWALCAVVGLLVALRSEYHAPTPFTPSKLSKSVADVRLWFFAPDCERPHMEFMVKQVVLSALHYTNLVPIAMLHCKNADLEKWFAEHNVTVVDPGQNSLVQFLDAHPRKVPRLGVSAWYRIAIPHVIDQLVLAKHKLITSLVKKNTAILQYVFYTDIDVVFMNNVSFQERMLPRYVAMPIQGDAWCCPSNPYKNEFHTNDGVFLMNVTSFREVQEEFVAYAQEHIMLNQDDDPSSGRFNDQTAFHDFFPVRRTHVPWYEKLHMRFFYATYYRSMYSKYYSDLLPKEYEWEPYLGVNPNAVVLHWHGPKPFLQSCSQLHPHFHAARNATHEHTRHYTPAVLSAGNSTALPMVTTGPGRSMFADKYNRVIKQLLMHNLTAPYVSHARLRSNLSPMYPESYNWYGPMQLTSEDRAAVVNTAEKDFHFLQTLTEGSLQGYHHATTLFFAYMNAICSENAPTG